MNLADYPIGSLESRAAVRAHLEATKESALFRGLLIQFVDSPRSEPKSGKQTARRCNCPPTPRGTIAFCHCFCATENGETLNHATL